jgi:leucyl-tRNA synthetase
MEKYDPKNIEKKWQKMWEEEKLNLATDDTTKDKLYVLDMFPYPSGDGLHLGHTENYVATDIYSRYFRMKEKNVLHPIGWDAFGLPAENFAIKTGVHPNIKTHENIKNFTRQIHELGASYDWSREIDTSSPEYYAWTQWWFLFLYENGWAYKKKAKVNWCESCKTVLANEQVENGVCERCKNTVIQKDLEQWFFKITDFADDLINDLDTVDWPESTKANQKHWIGRSVGVQFDMPVAGTETKIPVYTTRVDTVFGMTYVVVAPESELVQTLLEKVSNKEEVEACILAASKKTELERTELAKEKTGVELKGVVAVNPFNDKEVPVFIGDYVLANYGTGAVMAVPAHDERDFEFAQKYDLPIVQSIKPEPLGHMSRNAEDVTMGGGDVLEVKVDGCFTVDGTLVESGDFTGLSSAEAREKMGEWVEKQKIGTRKVNYRLRDWLVSRQRYWGAPIPVVYDPEGKAHPVPKEHLPWLLPTDVEFKPTGISPLADSKELKERTEKLFGKGWTPEIDTMDTFVCSSWYYFRYADPKNEKEFASPGAIKQWLPVDMYMGGAEHTVLHLMYARFFTKALHKKGLIDFNEPFLKLRHQGMILAEDGRKMSKSLGNVVNPDSVIETYGADTLRLHIMFMGPLEDMKPWSPGTILGSRRFVEKVWRLASRVQEGVSVNEALLHKTIQKVGNDIETLSYNTAISALMILVSDMEKQEGVSQESFEMVLKLIAPFAPHVAEELWHSLGHEDSIHTQTWPTFDLSKTVDDIVTYAVQINGKVRDEIEVAADMSQPEIESRAMASEKVQQWMEGRTPKKVIFVKGRLVNIVV